MKTKVIIHENRVKIYFRNDEHFVRYNTKIPALSVNEFYRADPNNLFYPLTEDNKRKNLKIKNLQNFIEEIIEDNLGRFNIVINNQFIRNRLSKTLNSNYHKRSQVSTKN